MTVAIAEDALHGNLEDFPLGTLLQMLANKNRTGVLVLDDGSEVWLSNGRIYLATTARGAAVDAVLFGADAGELDDIDAMFRERGAAADTERGVIDRIIDNRPHLEPMLRRLLHEYTLNALFELMVPSTAEFRFDPHRRHPLGDRFVYETGVLVAQAEQRLDIWRRIAARIPSTAAVYQLAHHLPDNRSERLVTADEWRLLSLIDGRRSAADIIVETGESAFRVCSTLYRLLIEQLIVEQG